jgi:signal peptidase I
VLYVKRAIGLPGETIEIIDKAVYINGEPIEEPYKTHSDPTIYQRSQGVHFLSSDSVRDNFGPLTLSEDSFFMMGDNRDDSADSRYWGALPRDYIVGRPLIVFWSYEDESDAYLKSSLPELIKLYGERVVFFFTRTRWSRMGHFVN